MGIKGILNKLKRNPDSFLKDITGVVHIGANIGQEKELYHRHNLNVIWIEPIPDVYERLKVNINNYPDQLAIEALVTDYDNREYKFNIANNDGASSSILEFKDHKYIWPKVEYSSSLTLKSITLNTLIDEKNIDIRNYQAFVIDTQGSELQVLQGSIPVLEHIKYIKIEVADFESYEKCCQLDDIQKFMSIQGYSEYSKVLFASSQKCGNYFDIVYKRNK